ncbi:MAG: aminotransferase class V-fold PLP-dependent enzyme [Cytophagaceae bacterium]|nr:aminotransferase class V-fold PLP-dependent enzyme [Cytophagaceae bacterium]
MANSKVYFTPGPSELYPTVKHHLTTALDEKIGTISHRSKTFIDIFKSTTDHLRSLLQLPDDFQILYLSSATEIWERIIQNAVIEKSFHLVNGSFSKRFYEFSGELGKQAYKVEAGLGEGFYPANITVPSDAEIICLTHNETSTGVSMPEEDIHMFREKNKNALIYIDGVSSLPYPVLDYSKIDSLFFSVQKCFGLPAGLGVWIVNSKVIDRAEALLKKGISIGTYHTLPSLLSKAISHQTPETPNVLNIYLLGKVIEDMLHKGGASALRKETEAKAQMVYQYVERSSVFSNGVADARLRSQTTIVLNTTIAPGEVNNVLEPFNMAIGAGYGSKKESQIRIANFPAHSPEQMEALVKILETKLG